MSKILMLIVTAMAVGQQWDVRFDADPSNVGLRIVTDCKGKVPFFSYDEAPIQGDWSRALVRKQVTPHGEKCTVVIIVLQNADPVFGDPRDDRDGESTIILTED